MRRNSSLISSVGLASALAMNGCATTQTYGKDETQTETESQLSPEKRDLSQSILGYLLKRYLEKFSEEYSDDLFRAADAYDQAVRGKSH